MSIKYTMKNQIKEIHRYRADKCEILPLTCTYINPPSKHNVRKLYITLRNPASIDSKYHYMFLEVSDSFNIFKLL